MEHIDNIFQYFTCLPIEIDGLSNVEHFKVRENGGFLGRYLWKINKNKLYSIAKEDEANNYARTYIVRDTREDQIVAYFSLRAGFVATNNKLFIRSEFDTIPGVEISNFAINDIYIKKHPEAKGIGGNIFIRFILPKAKEAQKYIGIHFVYIFALPYESLISHYETWGFQRLTKTQEILMHRRIRPRYDKNCIFMYQIL